MDYTKHEMLLATAIEPHVQFGDVEQAQEHAVWYKQPMDSEISRSVHHMAEMLFNGQDRLGLTEILDRIGDSRYPGERQTRLSALRTAIKLCAERAVARFAKMAELEDLVLIGEMGEPTERELMATA